MIFVFMHNLGSTSSTNSTLYSSSLTSDNATHQNYQPPLNTSLPFSESSSEENIPTEVSEDKKFLGYGATLAVNPRHSIVDQRNIPVDQSTIRLILECTTLPPSQEYHRNNLQFIDHKTRLPCQSKNGQHKYLGFKL